jgi:protein tyrosine phosphatase (PTP) superfamily phosphohydrolase (DUF442 family)
VDLREPSETSVGFMNEAAKRGLRYIPLPVNSSTIDRAHVDRFNFELASSDARPLYFFDSDGTRSATLWYIRRITVDRVDNQIARREAEEMGLNQSDYWLAATRFLEQRETSRPPASQTSQTQPIDRAMPPKADAAPEQATPAPAVSNQQPSLVKPADPARKPKATQETASRGNTAMRLPTDQTFNLRYSGLVSRIGLTRPLAHGSRSVGPLIAVQTQASLPAPARQPRSLLPALDA